MHFWALLMGLAWGVLGVAGALQGPLWTALAPRGGPLWTSLGLRPIALCVAKTSQGTLWA